MPSLSPPTFIRNVNSGRVEAYPAASDWEDVEKHETGGAETASERRVTEVEAPRLLAVLYIF